MKKITALFICLIMALSLCIPATASNGGLAVFGDSIATGFGLDGYSGTPDSAAASFANTLAAKNSLKYGVDYYNLAVDGMTSTDLLANLAAGTYDSVIAASDTIVISIGGNDLIGAVVKVLTDYMTKNAAMLKMLGIDMSQGMGTDGLASLLGMMTGEQAAMISKTMATILTSEDATAAYTAAAETYAKNITAIYTKILSVNPRANVIHVTPYNPFAGIVIPGGLDLSALSTLTDTYVKLMAASTAKVGDALTAGKPLNLSVISLDAIFTDKAMALTNMLAMDIHPNADGHALIAASIDECIRANPVTSTGSTAVVAPSTGDCAVVLAAVLSLVSMAALTLKKKHRA